MRSRCRSPSSCRTAPCGRASSPAASGGPASARHGLGQAALGGSAAVRLRQAATSSVKDSKSALPDASGGILQAASRARSARARSWAKPSASSSCGRLFQQLADEDVQSRAPGPSRPARILARPRKPQASPDRTPARRRPAPLPAAGRPRATGAGPSSERPTRKVAALAVICARQSDKVARKASSRPHGGGDMRRAPP